MPKSATDDSKIDVTPEMIQAGDIEITPEMARAGSGELFDFRPGEDSAEAMCERIYREMERARRLSRASCFLNS